MLTFLLIAILVISLGLNVATFILIRNLLKKQAIYEQWIAEFKDNVSETLTAMRQIDKTGVFATSLNDQGIFESDDHVGQIFKDLEALVEKLNDVSQ
jgi:hypothetical protein